MKTPLSDKIVDFPQHSFQADTNSVHIITYEVVLFLSS